MKKYVLLITLSISSVCSAGSIHCNGHVDKIGFHANNKLMLKLSSMNKAVMICNTESEWVVNGSGYRTGPEMCKALLSMLMHAKATKADLGNVWFDGDDVPASCDAWESWKSANLRYFLY